MNICLFSRQSICAPIAVNGCGSSGSPTVWTRSKSGEKALKSLLKAFELLRPHQLAAYSHGAALTTRAQLSARAQTFARGTWGYWVGCCYQKQQNLYIYVFFIFHFLYDFSKSIGTTHPFNLNRKKEVGKLLTHFCFYKITSGCRPTPPPSKVRNHIGVYPYRYKAIHA